MELIPTSGSNVVSPAELRASQRTQLDQFAFAKQWQEWRQRFCQNALLGESAREEEEHRLLPAHPRAGASLRSNRGGRKGRWRSSHRSQPNARSAVPVPTPKSREPARTVPPLQASVRRAASRSPSAGVGSAPKSPHVPRQVAIRSFQPEAPMDKRVSFRHSEERRAPRHRAPWGDGKKFQRGTSSLR